MPRIARLQGIAAGFAVLWLVAHSVTADEKKDSTFKTPEEAFDAARAAADKQDVQAFLDCLLDDSRDSMVGLFIHMSAETIKVLGATGGAPPDDQAEAMKKTVQLLKENGVTEEFLEQFAKELKEKKPADVRDFARRLIKLSEPVKNRTEFAVKLLKVAKPLKIQPWNNGLNGKLENVEVKGDTATGTVIQKLDDGKDRKVPLGFKKVDGSWKIDIFGGDD